MQAVLPGVREGLGGNQRTSPIVFKFCFFKGYSKGWLAPAVLQTLQKVFGQPFAVTA